MSSKKKNSERKKPGPKEEVLALDANWRMAVRHSVNKPKPENGWPEAPVKSRRKRKKTK